MVCHAHGSSDLFSAPGLRPQVVVGEGRGVKISKHPQGQFCTGNCFHGGFSEKCNGFGMIFEGVAGPWTLRMLLDTSAGMQHNLAGAQGEILKLGG